MFGQKNRKYAGEITHVGLDGKTLTEGIMQCVHCGKHWVPQPGSGVTRGFCRNCMGPLCSAECAQHCVSFEKQLDAYEKGVILGSAFK